MQPEPLVDHREGALAAARAARPARLAPHRGVILATNARAAAPRPPQTLVAGSTGQAHAERGVRFVTEPALLAASCSLKTPERRMALLLVMTGCVLVSAALESRRRQALQGHDATFPNHPGPRVQPPTARWVLHDVVGIHRLMAPGPWPLGWHLTDQPRPLLPLRGKPSMALYGVK